MAMSDESQEAVQDLAGALLDLLPSRAACFVMQAALARIEKDMDPELAAQLHDHPAPTLRVLT
jgi:hypothetical protein